MGRVLCHARTLFTTHHNPHVTRTLEARWRPSLSLFANFLVMWTAHVDTQKPLTLTTYATGHVELQ
jgi:hypothetical protein